MNYNEIMQKAGKQLSISLTYSNITIDSSNIYRARPYFNAKMVGTIMRGLEVELKSKLPYKTAITFHNKAKYISNEATANYGPYYVKDIVYNADKKTYTHQLCDEFIFSMVPYEPLEITYPCTVFNYFLALVAKLGWTTNIVSLPNGNRVMSSDVYADIGYTYRSVLEDIGQATATLFKISGSQISKATSSSEITINDDILRNANVEFGEHFGPINSVVLTRSGESDSVYKRDEEATEWVEYRVEDNQLMNNNDRADYLDELYDALYGYEYDIFDTELVGFGVIEPLQAVHFETGDKEYDSYVYNSEEIFEKGYKQSIYTEKPNETKTDYTVADKEDNKVRQAYIIVNKQKLRIDAIIDDAEGHKGIFAMYLDDSDPSHFVSIINASADNIVFNAKSLIFGEYPDGQYIEVKNYEALITQDEIKGTSWTFGDGPYSLTTAEYDLYFSCNVYDDDNHTEVTKKYVGVKTTRNSVTYIDEEGTELVVYSNGTWLDDAYKVMHYYEEPDDEWVAWIRANMTQVACKVGVLFDGSGTVRFTPKREFSVYNKDIDDVTINSLRLTGYGSSGSLYMLINKDPKHGTSASGEYPDANRIEMDSRYLGSYETSPSNLMFIRNYDTFQYDGSNSRAKNAIDLSAKEESGYIQISNYKDYSSNRANYIYLNHSKTEQPTYYYFSNTTTITNYSGDNDNNRSANSISMTSNRYFGEGSLSTNTNYIRLYNYDASDDNLTSNEIDLYSYAESYNSVNVYNRLRYWNGTKTVTKTGNELRMQCTFDAEEDDYYNEMIISNNKSTETAQTDRANYLWMYEDPKDIRFGMYNFSNLKSGSSVNASINSIILENKDTRDEQYGKYNNSITLTNKGEIDSEASYQNFNANIISMEYEMMIPESSIDIGNFDASNGDSANYITLLSNKNSDSPQNGVNIVNYCEDEYWGNIIDLHTWHSSQKTSLDIENYKYGGDELANAINLEGGQYGGGGNSSKLKLINYDDNSNRKSAEILLLKNGTLNSIEMNVYHSGSVVGGITLRYLGSSKSGIDFDCDQLMWNSYELYIDSSKYVRAR